MSAPVEISWFGALCDDDYEFLGVPNPELQSSWKAEGAGVDACVTGSGPLQRNPLFVNRGYWVNKCIQ